MINREHLYGGLDHTLVVSIAEARDLRIPGQPKIVYQPRVYVSDGRERVARYVDKAFPKMGRVVPHGAESLWVPTGTANYKKFLSIVREELHDKMEVVTLMADFFDLKELHMFAKNSEIDQRRRLEAEMYANLWDLHGKANKEVHIPSAAELAGRLDVSGMMNIGAKKGKPEGVIVTLRNIHTGTLEELGKAYEGSTVLPKRKLKSGNVSVQWSAGGEVATKVLEDILPFMVFRRNIVEHLLDYSEKRGHIDHGTPRTPQARAEREDIYQRRRDYVEKLHELKRMDMAA